MPPSQDDCCRVDVNLCGLESPGKARGPHPTLVGSSAGCGWVAKTLSLSRSDQKGNKSSCKQTGYGEITLIQCRLSIYDLFLPLKQPFWSLNWKSGVYQGFTHGRPQTLVFVFLAPWGCIILCWDFYCLGSFFPLGFSVSSNMWLGNNKISQEGIVYQIYLFVVPSSPAFRASIFDFFVSWTLIFVCPAQWDFCKL